MQFSVAQLTPYYHETENRIFRYDHTDNIMIGLAAASAYIIALAIITLSTESDTANVKDYFKSSIHSAICKWKFKSFSSVTQSIIGCLNLGLCTLLLYGLAEYLVKTPPVAFMATTPTDTIVISTLSVTVIKFSIYCKYLAEGE